MPKIRTPHAPRPTRRPAKVRLRLEELEDRRTPATLVGLTGDNSLVMFNSSSPSILFTRLSVTGLQAGESLVGIDFQPVTNVLVGLARSGRLYTINPTTGAATAGVTLAQPLDGTEFGFTFDGAGSSIAVYSNTNVLFFSRFSDGATLTTPSGPIMPVYNTGDVFAGRVPAPGGIDEDLFAIDSVTDTVFQVVQDTQTKAITIQTKGAVGLDTDARIGLDSDPSATTGGSFASLTPTSGGPSVLASLDNNGAVTLLGAVGGGTILRGLTVAPGKTPLGRPLLAVGQDRADSASMVRIYNSDGSDRFGIILPYGDAFTGGVTVATGDVTGDGVEDLIVGQAKDGSQVKVYDGTNNKELIALSAFGDGKNDFKGGAFVAAGDVDGDRIAELVVGAGKGGGPHVKAFDLKATTVTAPGAPPLQETLIRSFFAYNSSFSGGVTVGTGDLSGDRIDDIITGQATGGVVVRAFDGLNQGNVLADFAAYDPAFTGGVFVAGGDVDGNGRDEILTGAGAGGGPHVRAFDPSGTVVRNFFAFAAGFTGGVRVASIADPTAAGRDDIVTGSGAFKQSPVARRNTASPPIEVVVYDGQTLAVDNAFDAFGDFTDGVFVG